MDLRFCEYEVEKLRSHACSRQTKCNFFTLFHTTWEGSFSAALYVIYKQRDRELFLEDVHFLLAFLAVRKKAVRKAAKV